MTGNTPHDWRPQAEADNAWLESLWHAADEEYAAWRRERRKTRAWAWAIALVWLAAIAVGVNAAVNTWERSHALANQEQR